MVGPMARFNLNFDRLPESVRRLAAGSGLQAPCRNPFRGIVVRAIETVYACEEAIRIIEQYEPPPEPRVNAAIRAGVGHACTEAPRGILYHRYEIGGDGGVISARIVPPTSQNQKRREDDLRALLPSIAHLAEEELARRCEQAIRNYDPCISCATHFLRLTLERT
jgi:coenzyme F420-reducing hydrogenase alpha subunit